MTSRMEGMYLKDELEVPCFAVYWKKIITYIRPVGAIRTLQIHSILVCHQDLPAINDIEISWNGCFDHSTIYIVNGSVLFRWDS